MRRWMWITVLLSASVRSNDHRAVRHLLDPPPESAQPAPDSWTDSDRPVSVYIGSASLAPTNAPTDQRWRSCDPKVPHTDDPALAMRVARRNRPLCKICLSRELPRCKDVCNCGPWNYPESVKAEAVEGSVAPQSFCTISIVWFLLLRVDTRDLANTDGWFV